MNMPPAIWIVIAYLSGSVPFALLIGLAKGVDIRTQGSGNVGATNCGRVLGKKWGILCFICDVLKGMMPVLTAGLVTGWSAGASSGELTSTQAWLWLAVAVAAVLGHVFPIWLKFKGGKGVATGLGVLLGFWPILTVPGLVALGVWAAFILTTRYMSLSSIMAAMSLPIVLVVIAMVNGQPIIDLVPFIIVTVLLAGLVVARHRSNIGRLRHGEEKRLNIYGKKKDERG